MRGTPLTSVDRSRGIGDRLGLAADDRVVEGALWAVVVASVTLDVFTTWLGLSMGLSEGNPVMRWAIGGLGIAALGAAKLLVVCGAGALRTLRPRYGTAIALGLALPWTVTVLVNAVALATV
ncbi:DUF5658 family protein [Halosimplex pelagicum]|uniref:DUF5658 domain-containing protein n=1 Tax=Halosimplex pelagicum TaxID=869886 RepID=A0A7D5P7N1_9EURY|nr:DUF5658 family protein [Halosimplex pelagicum]QLH82663.1 hypothetical protein HZS54_13990 [Halosimplex pelagicum]